MHVPTEEYFQCNFQRIIKMAVTFLLVTFLFFQVNTALVSITDSLNISRQTPFHIGLLIWLKDLITRVTRSSSFSPPIGGE